MATLMMSAMLTWRTVRVNPVGLRWDGKGRDAKEQDQKGGRKGEED